jgi:hypothetical protein
MRMFASAALSAALGLASIAPAWATANVTEDAAPAVTRFKCEDGGDLTAQFVSKNANLIAIVDSGQGAHDLPLVPYKSGPIMLTWSDGQRTLTWSPGVQIMWMEGSTHRMCGRGAHDHGARPARPAQPIAAPARAT